MQQIEERRFKGRSSLLPFSHHLSRFSQAICNRQLPTHSLTAFVLSLSLLSHLSLVGRMRPPVNQSPQCLCVRACDITTVCVHGSQWSERVKIIQRTRISATITSIKAHFRVWSAIKTSSRSRMWVTMSRDIETEQISYGLYGKRIYASYLMELCLKRTWGGKYRIFSWTKRHFEDRQTGIAESRRLGHIFPHVFSSLSLSLTRKFHGLFWTYHILKLLSLSPSLKSHETSLNKREARETKMQKYFLSHSLLHHYEISAK